MSAAEWCVTWSICLGGAWAFERLWVLGKRVLRFFGERADAKLPPFARRHAEDMRGIGGAGAVIHCPHCRAVFQLPDAVGRWPIECAKSAGQSATHVMGMTCGKWFVARVRREVVYQVLTAKTGEFS